jgi:KaiC domain protein
VADDDDWFERALRDEDGEDDADEGDEFADAFETGDEPADDTRESGADDASDASSADASDAASGDAPGDASGTFDDAGDPADDTDGVGNAADAEDDPFGDDAGFADLDGGDDAGFDGGGDAEFDDAGGGGLDAGGDSNPFADATGGVDDAGQGASGQADDSNPFADGDANQGGGAGGDDLFEQDFASAFEGGGGGGGEFGFEGGEAGDGADLGDDLDDEEFDSDIPRIDLGIEGLDSMIQGGVPERSLTVVMGTAGTGKTTFGLQFLNHALESGESAVFITLEETRERILSTADEKGWDFPEYVDDDQLAVIDLDPIEMANSLTSIRSELPRLVEEFDATRLVLDSVSLLEMMYDDQATRRSEVYDFTKSLKQAGVTTMFTSEASEDNPFVSRYGIIEYLVDAVFVLRYVRPEDFRETRLAVEIQKIRDANHSRETKPYEITNSGISVYRQANIF